jgi:NAD(P)-dependent dehydrogenase (short-subunit alcohol dehydrogenase family)
LKHNFASSSCVITGGASGIGFALAQALLERGARVMIADRDAPGLAGAAQQLSEFAPRLHTLQVDVTQPEQVQSMATAAVQAFGRIDYLFNNAGIGGTLPIAQASMAQWQRIMDVNLWGVIHGITAVLPVMRQQGTGHIVNTSSISGIIPVPGQALYNTTKYAVVGLSESLRLELEPDGIAVTVVCPGPVASRIWGTPIIGERIDRTPPAHAVPAADAAETILLAVAQRQGIVVLPRRDRRSWQMYRWFPRLTERAFRAIARERRTLAG